MSVNLKKTTPPKSTVKKQSGKKSSLPFTAENYYLFFGALAVIIIGYICMASGEVNGAVSLTVSPILVCIGYLILIPLSLFYRKKTTNPED